MTSGHDAATKTVDSTNETFQTLDEGFNDTHIRGTSGIHTQTLHIKIGDAREVMNSVYVGLKANGVWPQLDVVGDNTCIAFVLTRGFLLGAFMYWESTHALFQERFLMLDNDSSASLLVGGLLA